MIYLDNAGTTKMFDECIEVHKTFSCENFYNPSAATVVASDLSKKIYETERFFLDKLGASEGNVLFTGCATESNNMAVKGSLRSGNYEYVFSCGEHPSIYNVAKKLEQDGKIVHFVPLQVDGKINLDCLKSVLNEKTRLISIIHVNNETGAINDLKKISDLKRGLCPKAVLHVDGVQAFMKIPFSIRNTAVDLYSFSAHKLHGPKGIAGLYVRNKNALKELLQGGGQQYGLRSGTENVSGIMQFQKAVSLIDVNENYKKTENLKKVFNNSVQQKGIRVLDFEGSPYIECLRFEGVKGETMLHALEQNGVIVGLGSACSSKKAGNRILQEMGFTKEEIISTVRISFNAYQSEDEIVRAGNIIKTTYLEIKERVS